uniref:Reverse transcriptase zinc-binding domain-containing protein n=1 Tax=Setaria viridis TaxID=4556 RepID=A0A4U6WBM7_SETVI|nr:hypothetical protein SEVIR_1G164800v2 [Setaria viridis]
MALPSYSCVLSQHNNEETLFHLLLQCPFAQEYWINISLFANLTDEPYTILTSFKTQLQVPFFMKIIVLMSWCIWMARNDCIFRGITPSVQDALLRFKIVFTQVVLRVKEAWKQPMLEWLEHSL